MNGILAYILLFSGEYIYSPACKGTVQFIMMNAFDCQVNKQVNSLPGFDASQIHKFIFLKSSPRKGLCSDCLINRTVIYLHGIRGIK